jgi:hypothetical protein
MTSQVCLSVPNDFTLPDVYTSTDPLTVSLALTLGARAYETLNDTAIQAVRSETHADALKSFEVSHKKESEEQFKRLRQEKAQFEEAYKAAQTRIEALEQSAAAVRLSATKAARESFEELIRSKDDQNTQLQRLIDSQLVAVSGRMDTLQSSITRSFSSSKEKGAFGESFTETMLKMAFDCDIQAISKDAQTADIRMIRGSEQEYFWEVKNYSRMVTTDEVEKFRRDMRLHPNIRGGCLVSLRTGIVGRARGGDIDIEFLADGRFILYISHLNARDNIVFYLQTLRPLFQVAELYSKPPQEETETVRNLEMKATLVANLLRSHSATVSKHRNAIVSHKKRVDGMFAEFQSYIMESDSQIENLLKVALGSDKESDEVLKETETTLPSSVFLKERLSEYDGRTKSFVSWLLEVTKGGGQLEIKELIERARAPGFGEKFVRDSRDDVFQQMAWIKGSRFIHGLQWA